MKKILYGLILLMFVHFIASPAQAALTWSMYDQFNGPELDSSKWISHTEGFGAVAPYVKDGRLVLEAANSPTEADSEVQLAVPVRYSGIIADIILQVYTPNNPNNPEAFEAGMEIHVDFGNEYGATFELNVVKELGSFVPVGKAFIENMSDSPDPVDLPEKIITADWSQSHSVGIAIDGSNILFLLDGSVAWIVDGENYNPAFTDARIEILTNSGSVKGYVDNVQVSAPVPIPAAVWLLGSGLIALVGLRKKLSK